MSEPPIIVSLGGWLSVLPIIVSASGVLSGAPIMTSGLGSLSAESGELSVSGVLSQVLPVPSPCASSFVTGASACEPVSGR